MNAPLPFTWDGEAMTPLPRFAKECDRRYIIGERYFMDEVEERSDVSHEHEFAWLREAWLNLPEKYAELYPTAEHLRKRALIEAGWYDEQIVDAGSNAAALRVAAAFRSREEFALVIVRGAFVVIRTAKSQSRRAMKREEFQRSKTAIMEIVAAMIGVEPSSLSDPFGDQRRPGRRRAA
jgi:hypothetical protein